MSRRIAEPEWVIQNIAVSIEALRIGGIGYNGVGTEKAVKIRVVVAGVVEVQPDLRILDLPGKATVGGHCAAARLPIRIVPHIAHFVTTGIGAQAGAAQVATVQVGEGAALSQRYPLAPEDVVGSRRRLRLPINSHAIRPPSR